MFKKINGPSTTINVKQTNIMNEEQDFIIRPYSKKELALMYFPDSNPRTAGNHFRAWIQRCQPLWDELHKLGYKSTAKQFTSKEVRVIVNYLGSP